MNRKTMLVLATAGAVAGASALTCASVAGSGPRTTVGSVHAHAAVFTDGAPAGSEATYPVPMATDADFASEVAQRAELLGLPAPSLSETATNRVCAAEASTPSTADEPHAYVCFPDTGSAASYVRGGDVATSSVQTAALRIGYVPRGSGGTRASVSGAYLIGVLEYNNGGSNLVYGAGTCTHGFPNNDYFVDNLNSNMWTAGLYSGIYDGSSILSGQSGGLASCVS